MTLIFAESEYQTRILPDILNDGTHVYVAFHPELRGLRAHGRTPEEAFASLQEGFEILREDSEEDGIDMPKPEGQQMKVIWRSIQYTVPFQMTGDPSVLLPSAALVNVNDDKRPVEYASGS